MRNALFLVSAAWLTTALAVSSCAPEGDHDSDGPPEWVKVGQDADTVFAYLSTAPAEKVDGHLVVRLKVFYKTPHRGPSNKPSTVSIWQIEYDCANHRSAMRAAYALSRPETDTLDRVLYPSPTWHNDTESSNAQLIAQRVCPSENSAKAK